MRTLSIEISNNDFAILHYQKFNEAALTSLAYGPDHYVELLALVKQLLKTNQPVEEPPLRKSMVRRLLRR